MAAFPVGLAFLVMVPGPAAVESAPRQVLPKVDTAVATASFDAKPVKITAGTPAVPRPSLPLAVDQAGKVYEPVVPAIYEEPVSAEEAALPSPQHPRGVTTLPPLSPVPSASPAPSA